jgi:energy-coupling factor transporter transmembrane protein EcfT
LQPKARATHSKYHPLLWWLWAALTTIILFLQNNRWTSIAIIIATLFVVYWSRSSTYWFQTMRWALRFALIAFTLRMAIGFIIGVPMPGTVLFSIPQIRLPEFLVGIRVGGDVTSQRLLSALDEALLLVALILVFAGANALSNPHNLLRVLPKRFYGIGLASVIASSVAPQAARSITRVRNAKRLRGQPSIGIKSWRSVALPVLEDSLERSIDLAASLESRGYGYFDKPTKYRPEKWGQRELFALSGPLYAILAIVTLDFPPMWLALLLFICISTPALAS